MKTKIFWGISVAAALLFCGCTDTTLQNMDTSSSSQTTSSQSSFSSATSSTASQKETITISKRTTFAADKTYTVFQNTAIVIEDGGEFLVDGKMASEKGGEIIIENGGSMIMNNEVSLECNLTIQEGGKLIVGEKGSVSGGGSIIVEDSFDDIKCSGSVKAKIVPPEPVKENGVTYVGGVLIVNKKYSLPSDFGSELILDDDAGTGLIIDEAYDALLEMREASGYEMPIVSGFRSYRTQTAIYNRNVAEYGEAEANTWSAKPGESEHQTGMAIDISSLEQSYGDTEEGKWLAANCHKYGFIIRYQKEKESVTGYIFEPWHVRYLGESTARLVHDSGLALEEFLGVEG